jgi:hypothetical protein
MARRRVRPQPPELRLVAPEAVEVQPRDRLDPRVVLIAPEEFARDPERLLAWARLNAPAQVRTDAAAQLAAQARANLAAMTPERARELAARARAARRNR